MHVQDARELSYAVVPWRFSLSCWRTVLSEESSHGLTSRTARTTPWPSGWRAARHARPPRARLSRRAAAWGARAVAASCCATMPTCLLAADTRLHQRCGRSPALSVEFAGSRCIVKASAATRRGRRSRQIAHKMRPAAPLRAGRVWQLSRPQSKASSTSHATFSSSARRPVESP